MIELSDEITNLLERNGLAPLSGTFEQVETVVRVRCDFCLDIGFVKNAVGDTVRCQCSRVDYASRYLKNSGLTKKEQDYHLQFQPTRRINPRAVDAMVNVLNRKPPHGMVVLFGGYDAGKSGLLMATVARACKTGREAVYILAGDLLDQLKATFESTDSTDAVMSRYKNVPILAIDELDKVKQSEWSFEQFNKLFDWRHRNRLVSATLLATNAMPDRVGDGEVLIFGRKHPELAYLDSRLKDAKRIGMKGIGQRGVVA